MARANGGAIGAPRDGSGGDMVPKIRNTAAAAAAVLAVCAGAVAGSRARAANGELPVLGRLESGLWELRNLDRGGRFAPVCLGDRALLVQLQHRGLSCVRSIVTQGRDALEVRYNCPAGFGQTTIRVETPRLARIESRGVDGGIPFEFRAEARRVGACS
jgi:hypothetical protein